MNNQCKETLRAGSVRQCQLEEGHDDVCIHSGIAYDIRGRHAGNYKYTWNFKE